MSSRDLPALARRLVHGLLLAWIGGALSASPATAQLPNLLELSGEYVPSVDLPPPGPASTQVSSYDAVFNVPIPLGESTFLIVGPAYHVDSVSYGGGFGALRAFHSLELGTMLVQLLPRDWSLALRLAPGLSGDLARIDDGLVRFSSVLMANHSFSDQLMLGFGGITSYSFGSFLALPALYLEWKPTPRLTLEAFVPAFIELRYRVGDRVDLGLTASVSGNEYAIREPAYGETWPCRAQATDDPTTPEDERAARPSDCLDHLAYSVVTTGVQVDVRLVETLWLSMFGGYTVYRRSELMNAGNTLVPGGGQDIPLTGVVRAGLEWRLPTGD